MLLQSIDQCKKDNLNKNKISLSEDIEHLEHQGEHINDAREELQKKISVVYRDVSNLSHKINYKEKEKERVENRFNREFWPGINPKYSVYKRQYIGNKICPVCNADLGETVIKDEIGKCFFCHTI